MFEEKEPRKKRRKNESYYCLHIYVMCKSCLVKMKEEPIGTQKRPRKKTNY